MSDPAVMVSCSSCVTVAHPWAIRLLEFAGVLGFVLGNVALGLGAGWIIARRGGNS